MLRTGDAIYDYQAEMLAQSSLVSPNPNALPFMFPPYAALPFVPLALGSYLTGYFLFLALNLCFCGVALAVMRPYTASLDAHWRPLAPLLFLSFMPLGIALMFGQVSILLLLLYCACFAALQGGRQFLAGIILSVALIKFQIALPVTLLFLIWRQWRFLKGFLLGALVLALISVRLTGVKVLESYGHSLFFMSHQASNAAGEARYAMFSAQMPNLYGFFHTVSRGAPWGLALTFLFSLLVLVWAAMQKPSLPLALLAGILVSYHLYLYDLTLLLLPISLAFNENMDLPVRGREKGSLYASAFLALSSLWGAFIVFDCHYLVAVPVAALFVCFERAPIPASRPALGYPSPASYG